VIQDVWTGATVPPSARTNIDAARRAGFRVGAYCVINPHVQSNISMVPDDVDFCALDCEYYDDLRAAKVRQESDNLHAKHPEWPRIVYTSRYYWRDVIGDDPNLSIDHYLWDARPNDANINTPLPFLPYGGWDESRVIGVQRTSTININGMELDLNDFRMELLDMDNQVLEMRMLMASAALKNDMQYLVDLLRFAGVISGETTARKSKL